MTFDKERAEELASRDPTTYTEESFRELEDCYMECELLLREATNARAALHEAAHTEGYSDDERHRFTSTEHDIEVICQTYQELYNKLEATFQEADEYLYG